MRPHNILNQHLEKLIENKAFMQRYLRKVAEENVKDLPIWQPIDLFTQMACEIETLIDVATLLIDLEIPTRYLASDVLALYIKEDSRFKAVRGTIPHVLGGQDAV